MQVLYIGATHTHSGTEDHMHGADQYLQNLYAGAHHLTAAEERQMHGGHGDEDHMHGADQYEQLQDLHFSLKRAARKVGHVAKKVVSNPIVQKVAIDGAIAAVSAQ